MQKLAVVYFPKINLEKITNFRKKYDPSWQIIPPHITIVSPISDISENHLIEHIETVTKNIQSFSIHLTGFIKTLDDNLFLQVREGNDEIVNLHDTLYSGILSQYVPTDFLFNPHITLGSFRTKNNKLDDTLYAKAYKEAQALNFDITSIFDAISIIKGDGISPAILVKTITLLKSS